MMENHLGPEYWENRYTEQQTQWDIGSPSTPLKTYIDQLKDPSISVLIPGGGNAYEAEYLFNQGFKRTFVVDIAQAAKDNFMDRCPGFPEHQFLVQDFFTLENRFDLILEQTFFCALNPNLRPDYAKKMHQLLKPKGALVGLLFSFPLADGPPFGGSKQEYLGYFEPFFHVAVMEPCYNSIPPRQGNELFFKLYPKTP